MSDYRAARYLKCFLGMVKICSSVAFLFILDRSVVSGSPLISASSFSVLRFPFHQNFLVIVVLSICWLGVAQRQFSLKYPLSLSILSKLLPFGLAPISARKTSKHFHSGHIVIPRPAYCLKEWCFLFSHRCFMLCHDLYVGVRDILCVNPLVFRRSLQRHPQEMMRPLTSEFLLHSFSIPQSHLTSAINSVLPFFEGFFFGLLNSFKTINFPKRFPVKGFGFAIAIGGIA